MKKLKLVDATTNAQEEQPLQEPIKQTGYRLRIKPNKILENLPPRSNLLQDDRKEGGQQSKFIESRPECKELDEEDITREIRGLSLHKQQLVGAFVKALRNNSESQEILDSAAAVIETLQYFAESNEAKDTSGHGLNSSSIVHTEHGSFPRYWKNRPSGWKNPVSFIKIVYEKEIEKGSMVRSDLASLDYDLSVAYASWIRPDRHPEDRFLREEAKPQLSEDEKKERQRILGAERQARLRERRKLM